MADHDAGETKRVTAPMQEFSTRAVAIGAVVAVVGCVLVFGLPAAIV